VSEGSTVGLNIAHPIDHLILICALYRLRVASASISASLDAYLDHVPFDAVLTDSINPLVSRKQPAAKLFLVDMSWFTSKVTFSVAERTGAKRDPNPDWVCRVTCFPDDPQQPVVKTTSRALEAQLITYRLAALPDWERMISVVALHTLAGLLQGLTALWLGRTVCVADAAIARKLIVAYKHHYLVAGASDLDPILTQQANDFMALLALRGAYVSGQRFPSATIAKCLETVSSNTVLSYTHPAIGIIAYGAAARMNQIEGAVGFVAPWVEVQVLGNDGAAVGPEQEGALRFRDRGDQTGVNASEHTGWIYPGQRARLMKNNVLAIR
jgi:hypothetical protein